MSTTDPNSPAAPTTATSRAEGQKLAGCYALSRRLDIGEGVEVWLAHDEVLGKDVSLHFVPDGIRKDSRALQELRLDVKRNRQLIHPNILRVYDLVEEPEWAAISMDSFEGESLAQRIGRQGGAGARVDEIRTMVEQLAQTLEEAHKINVLHRDLTPSNLFLTSSGKLLVANFGISRTIRDAQTRAGVAESPGIAYESPQLLEGNTPARTDDIYSLGAVLFALLTGRAPFTGQNLAQQARAGVSSETLAALHSDAIPPNWQSTIAACLDKNPEARPQKAAEVGQRLATVVEAPAPAPETAPVAEPIAAAAPGIAPEVAASEPKSAPVPEELKPPTPAVAPAPAPVLAAEPAPAPKPVEPAPKPAAAPKETRREPESPKPATPDFAPKAPERPAAAEFKPRLYPEEPRFPVTILAAAAAVIVVLALIYHFATRKSAETTTASTEVQPEKVELRTPAPSTPVVDAPVVETTLPKAQTPPPVATPSPAEKAIAERTAVLEKARTEAQAAEKTHADLLKQQQMAEASVAEVQKTISDKTESAKAMKKAADEAAAQRKKLEDAQKVAEAAALEAQKLALEKVRLAEESAKALLELDKQNAEKMSGPQQAEAEIAELQKTLAEKQQVVTDGAKALAQAEAARQQQLATVTDHQREIERIKASDVEAQRQRDAAEAERTRLDRELAEMQRAFKEKMAELEAKRQQLSNPSAATPPKPAQTPAPATPAVVVTPAATPAATPALATPKAATPKAAATPKSVATPPPKAAAATPEPVQMVNIPAATPPSLKPATPAPSPTVTTEGGNSLGMKFVPVGDVEFCVWQTRVRDFEVFAKAVNLRSNSWKGPGFKQGPDHPVVNVSWQEAIAFCKWLTDKERKENMLPANEFYRLPSDLEWSKAVGLPEEAGKTPELRDMGIPDVYPWGNAWPPPPGAGNYTGEETGSDVAIKGYEDGFAWTSPVGSFPPNKFGLYDMGGNVWQWCMDSWNAESKAKVLRGASWYNGALKLSLLSACRVHASPDSSTDNYGFRIVRAKEEGKPSKK